jgi:hypothetical protein
MCRLAGRACFLETERGFAAALVYFIGLSLIPVRIETIELQEFI